MNKQYEFDFATVMDLHKTADGLVDVCVGPMTAPEVASELLHYSARDPNYMVIIMERKSWKNYRASIYIDSDTFENKGRKKILWQP